MTGSLIEHVILRMRREILEEAEVRRAGLVLSLNAMRAGNKKEKENIPGMTEGTNTVTQIRGLSYTSSSST